MSKEVQGTIRNRNAGPSSNTGGRWGSAPTLRGVVQVETPKQAQVSHSDTSAKESLRSLISALGEPTGVVRAPLETDTTTLTTLTNSPPGPRAPSPHLQNPSHQGYLGLFSYQQQSATIGMACPTVRRQNRGKS